MTGDIHHLSTEAVKARMTKRRGTYRPAAAGDLVTVLVDHEADLWLVLEITDVDDHGSVIGVLDTKGKRSGVYRVTRSYEWVITPRHHLVQDAKANLIFREFTGLAAVTAEFRKWLNPDRPDLAERYS